MSKTTFCSRTPLCLHFRYDVTVPAVDCVRLAFPPILGYLTSTGQNFSCLGGKTKQKSTKICTYLHICVHLYPDNGVNPRADRPWSRFVKPHTVNECTMRLRFDNTPGIPSCSAWLQLFFGKNTALASSWLPLPVQKLHLTVIAWLDDQVGMDYGLVPIVFVNKHCILPNLNGRFGDFDGGPINATKKCQGASEFDFVVTEIDIFM